MRSTRLCDWRMRYAQRLTVCWGSVGHIYQYMRSLGIEPTTLPLPASCPDSWATRTSFTFLVTLLCSWDLLCVWLMFDSRFDCVWLIPHCEECSNYDSAEPDWWFTPWRNYCSFEMTTCDVHDDVMTSVNVLGLGIVHPYGNTING